ncbi:uncharacterized protein LOC143920789 [Arctopsyche grandis]|uniref:uncharacterized protein LOC143920789 n=1 Tax=Arctopsyche grandis TaxID=121162 RepID=UPI00406D78C5
MSNTPEEFLKRSRELNKLINKTLTSKSNMLSNNQKSCLLSAFELITGVESLTQTCVSDKRALHGIRAIVCGVSDNKQPSTQSSPASPAQVKKKIEKIKSGEKFHSSQNNDSLNLLNKTSSGKTSSFDLEKNNLPIDLVPSLSPSPTTQVPMVCGAVTGYIFSFKLYSGSGLKLNEIVMELLENSFNKWHHVYMDNLYKSVELKKIDCVVRFE